MKVLVIGASRGLGLEFARQYRADGAQVMATARDGAGLEFVRQYRADGAQVVATARDDAGLARLRELGATPLELDVADAASAAALARAVDGAAFDVTIVNAGVYGPRSDGLVAPSAEDFDRVMHTNVLGAMRVLSQLAGALAPGARVAVISSRMGSIGLRTGSSGWLYRASKAALNSVLKDAALAFDGRAICVALHPGWVRTDMGGDGADLAAEQSVADMRATLARLQPSDNGRFLNHDGAALAW